MKVNGTATLNAPRDAVWVALNDPAVLVRTIPGCQQLEEVGPDAYRMTLTAGVASIKGTYTGDVALTDQEQPGAFTLRATGAGAPGTVQADVRVTLADGGDGTTRLDYDADAVVGGMIGGVGQRVLTGVAKKTAGEFFRAVDDVLTGKAPAVPTLPAPREETAHPTAAPGAAVFTAPASAPAVVGSEFLRGAVFGAVVALAGVLVGGFVTRRRA
jgi:carbon monoxide dehydrogenase subunit G